MVDLYTGVPRSGKTYRVVNKCRDIATSKDRKYKHVFTNINGLNYKKLNEFAGEPDYFQPFEFLDLKREILQEYDYYQIQKNGELPDTVTDYDEFIKSEGIYKKYIHSLIIIDECHLYFEAKAEDSLIRFLSYHGHFEIDIDLITQNKNLIDKKYLSFIETMYMALPASKRLVSFFGIVKFRYRKYASYQEYHANIMGTESLGFKKEVYELYNSGGTTIGKSASGKFIVPVVIVAIITFIGYRVLVSHFTRDTPVQNQDSNVTEQQPKQSSKPINADISDSKKSFFVADCFANQCRFKNTNTTFIQSTMMIFVNKFECKIIVNEIIDTNYSQYILQCDEKLQELLKLFQSNNQGALSNEKSTSSTTNLNPFSSGK